MTTNIVVFPHSLHTEGMEGPPTSQRITALSRLLGALAISYMGQHKLATITILYGEH